MKIYEKNINIITYKIMLSKNILKTVSYLKAENQKILFLTPLTTMEDIFNFKKDSSLEKLINEIDYDYRNKLINEKYILELSAKINDLIQEEIIMPAFEYNKLIKSLLNISNEKLTQSNIDKVLIYINNYFPSADVVISGFDIDLVKFKNLNINVLYIVSNLKGVINIKNIESVCIENKNDFFQIEDKESLISFLEHETKMVITIKNLNDFFNGELNFNSFLIEKAFNKIY